LKNTHDIIGHSMKKEDAFVGIVRIETVRIDNVPVTLKVGFSVRSSSKAETSTLFNSVILNTFFLLSKIPSKSSSALGIDNFPNNNSYLVTLLTPNRPLINLSAERNHSNGVQIGHLDLLI
jgi:hypothetical protein